MTSNTWSTKEHIDKLYFIKIFKLFFSKDILKRIKRIPGGPAIKTLNIHHKGPGSILGQGTKTPEAAWSSQLKNRDGERVKI